MRRSHKFATIGPSVLSQLGREPARVEYSPPDESAPVNLEIQRDIFAEKIRTWMYGREPGEPHSR
jgi:hypothetical protein